MEELQRQAGWAKSFGLPIELISAAEAQRAVPADEHRGRAGRRLPAAGRLPRPQPADLRAGRRRPPARGRASSSARASPASRCATAACTRCVTDKGTIRTDVVINAGGMYAPQIARDGGRARCRSSPTRTSSWSPRPSIRRWIRCRRCATPTTSSTSAPRWAAWSWAATSATRRRGRWTACPTASRRSCCPRTGSGSTSSLGNSIRRVPAMDDAEVRKLFNGPEAFTPDGEFILGESRRARLLGGGRLLRARAGRRRRHGLADGRVDRRRRAQPRPLAHGHPPLRRPVPQPGLHAGPRHRGVRDLLRHQVPQPRAPGRAAAAAPAGLRAAAPSSAPPSARSRAGSGPTGSSRTPAARRRVAAARAAGRASTGRPPSTPRRPATRERAGLFDESSFAKFEVHGPGRARAASSACARTTSTARSARSPTRRC